MLKILINLQWLCIISGVVIDLSLEDIVYPKEIADFINKPENEPTLIYLSVMFPALIMYIISSIGLYLKKKWAFYFYIIAQSLCLLSIPIDGYYITSGYGGFFCELAMILIGATIISAYYTIWKPGLTSRYTGDGHE